MSFLNSFTRIDFFESISLICESSTFDFESKLFKPKNFKAKKLFKMFCRFSCLIIRVLEGVHICFMRLFVPEGRDIAR